jgi:hypothetical protein
LKDILRTQLRYRGLAITDDLDMKALTRHHTKAAIAVRAIQAGANILLYCNEPDSPPTALDAIEKAVRDKQIPLQTILDNQNLVLQLKRDALKEPVPEWSTAQALIGCDEHQALSAAVAAGTDKLTFINTGATPGTLARATKGGISYPTGGASGNASVLTGVSATAFRPTITATSKVIFAARVSIPTITNVLVQVGLGQAPSATDPGAANSGTDSAEFFFDPANALASGLGTTALGNWLVRWRSASGTVTYRDTGVPVVAGHDYNLAIAFNDSIQPVFLINSPEPFTVTFCFWASLGLATMFSMFRNIPQPIANGTVDSTE